MRRIWIDYMAPCDVFFFKSVISDLMARTDYSVICTAREYAETQCLLMQNCAVAEMIDRHEVRGEIP